MPKWNECLTDGGVVSMKNKKEVRKLTEYDCGLDKVIESNSNIFSRIATLENKITAMISLYRDVVVDNGMLEKRVRRLEQKESYLNEGEAWNIKIGGTD